MTNRVLVAGIGNIFCTDDGFGPAVVARLLESEQSAGADGGVRVADYGIRGMHLAYDLLDPPDVLILVDALPDRGAPGQVCVLRIQPEHVPPSAGDGGQLDAHGMDPATLLGNLVSLGGQLPDVTVLVGCQTGNVDEGMGLTPAVAEAVDDAADVVRGLLERFDRHAGLSEVV